MAQNKSDNKVKYIAPSKEEFNKYARDVCRELGKCVDPAYDRPQIANGLSEFLRKLTEINVEKTNE